MSYATGPGGSTPRCPRTPHTPGGNGCRGKGGEGRARNHDGSKGSGRGQVRHHDIGGRGLERDPRKQEGKDRSASERAQTSESDWTWVQGRTAADDAALTCTDNFVRQSLP